MKRKELVEKLDGCYGFLICATGYNPQKIIWVERSIFQTGIILISPEESIIFTLCSSVHT